MEKEHKENRVKLALDGVMLVEDGFPETEVTKGMMLMGVQDKYNNVCRFLVGSSVPFEKLTDTYCKMTGRSADCTWFSLDGVSALLSLEGLE